MWNLFLRFDPVLLQWAYVLFLLLSGQMAISPGRGAGPANATPPAHQTWYVDPVNGGPRYSAGSTGVTADCTGLGTTTFNPAGGRMQPCPFEFAQNFWNDGWVFNNRVWVGAGGDTYIFKNCTSAAPCELAGNASSSAPGDPCFTVGTDCHMPTIPAGTSGAHTKLLGENWASCQVSKTFTDASAPTLAGDPTQQSYVYGEASPIYILDVEASQHVDIQCLDVAGHGGQAGNGIFSGNTIPAASDDINILDVTFHGFASRGWLGNVGGTWNLTRVTVQFNLFAGIDNDPGSGQASFGTINGSYLSIFGNGCSEEYPITHTFPAVGCKDQTAGGYGDGWGTPVTFNLNINCDHCLAAYNTQDGIDGGHTVAANCSITNSQMYGNMGGNLKCGPNNNLTFTNNIINANCMRMSASITGSIAGFNSMLSLWCRAFDQNTTGILSTATTNTDGFITYPGSGVTVTGTSTHFLTDYHIGDNIIPGDSSESPYPYSSWSRTVASIIDDTHMTLNSAWPGTVPQSGSPQVFVVQIPFGGATSPTRLLIYGNTFIGYGNNVWDENCQTGNPQLTIDNSLCPGLVYDYRDNITNGYSIAAYNSGASPAQWNGILPTIEDYNLFYGLNATYGTGAHDLQVSPQNVSQPASPMSTQASLDAYDFHLTGSSPTIGAGVAILLIPSDFYGTTRPNPPSMGAVEF